MGSFGYGGSQVNQLNSAKFVTRKARLRRMNTLINRGTMTTETQLRITDHRWIQKDSRTTRFIPSNPVVKFEGEPPF